MNGTIKPYRNCRFRGRIAIGRKRFERIFGTEAECAAWLDRMRVRRSAHLASRDSDKVDAPVSIVYFVGAEPLGRHPIKIGFTTNKSSVRIVGTQVGNPLKIVTHAEMLGSRKLEKWIHSVLAPYRMNGEWFAPRKAVLQLVRAAIESPCRIAIQREDAEPIATRPATRRGYIRVEELAARWQVDVRFVERVVSSGAIHRSISPTGEWLSLASITKYEADNTVRAATAVLNTGRNT